MSVSKQVYKILEEFGEQLVKDTELSLKQKHGGAANNGTQSTGLAESIDFSVKEKGDGFVFSFYMNDYWVNLQYGRGKTKVGKSQKEFKDTLAGKLYYSDWYSSKGLNPQDIVLRNYLDKLKNPSKSKGLKSLTFKKAKKAFAIMVAKSIHKKGWKRYPHGSDFFGQVVEDGRFYDLGLKLSEIYGKEILFDLRDILKPIG